MRIKDQREMEVAYLKGGFRERYAMTHGKRTIITLRGNKCYKFTYSTENEYQDANGSTYDTVERKWIN